MEDFCQQDACCPVAMACSDPLAAQKPPPTTSVRGVFTCTTWRWEFKAQKKHVYNLYYICFIMFIIQYYLYLNICYVIYMFAIYYNICYIMIWQVPLQSFNCACATPSQLAVAARHHSA